MKKIYSLLAMVLVAGATFAQTMTLTIEGKEVKNGETVVVNKTLEEISTKLGPLTIYDLHANVELVSSIAQSITLYGEDLDKAPIGHLACCPTGFNCTTADESNGYVSECEMNNIEAGQKLSGPTFIHYSFQTNFPGDAFSRKAHIKFIGASEAIEFDIVFNVGEAASMKGVELTTTKAGAMYDMQGIRVNNPLGIYIKNGKKFIKK